MYHPHENLKLTWKNHGQELAISTPWVTMELDIEPAEKEWIEEAAAHIHTHPEMPSVQTFCKDLKDYPLFYRSPRSLSEFDAKSLQACPELPTIDFSCPLSFLKTLGVEVPHELESNTLSDWSWDLEEILKISKIENTELYDPLTFTSYLILYRLNKESTTWSGQNGLGEILEKFRNEDEQKFFRAVGWITRQSHYVTKQFHISVLPALESFPVARPQIEHFITDEVGHYKFMEQTLTALGFDGPQEFELGEATRWMLDASEQMGRISPLAFSAMINLFEAAYYEGEDPISSVLKKSSRPEAARGYDLHYKINQEHRHCDMPLIFSQYLAPHTKEHLELTVRLFEMTLHMLDEMEKKIENFI